jgi:SM-20-related protein
MIDLKQIARQRLETDPYSWAMIDDLFSREDAEDLAASFPCDHFKSVSGHGPENNYKFEARALIEMGARNVAHGAELREIWLRLTHELLTAGYRSALAQLTGCDLSKALLEVNVFHYGAGALMGPHVDLPDKILTHVFYFNRSWDREAGGCLTILRSDNPAEIVAEIAPPVGGSAVVVRSNNSWHAVSRVVNNAGASRRIVTATFYHPGSISSLWPTDDRTPLHHYQESASNIAGNSSARTWRSKLKFWR